MTLLKHIGLMILAILIGMTTSACSDKAGKEHFASSQQRALEKAKNVNNVLEEADKKQREQLEKMER